MDPFCYLCFMFGMLSCLFIAALWSPAGKGVTFWLSCVMYQEDKANQPALFLSEMIAKLEMALPMAYC